MPLIADALRDVLPGLAARPVTLDDAVGVAALMRRVSTAAVGKADATVDEVRDELSRTGFDPLVDAAVVVDPTSGSVMVYAEAHDEHSDRAYIDVFVEPSLPDEAFNGAAIAALKGVKARIAEAIEERGAARTTVAAGLYRGEDRMRRSYEAVGFKRENVYWRMSIDLDDWSAPGWFVQSRMPAGLAVTTVDPDDDAVLKQALQIRNEAFRGQHGQVHVNFSIFASRHRSGSKYDRTAWWFAFLAGEVVGICLADNSKAEEGAGYVQTLAVIEKARGLGIAKALLHTAFAEYQRRGRTSVQLGVDASDNLGAIRLYETVGMRPILTIDSLAMEITTARGRPAGPQPG